MTAQGLEIWAGPMFLWAGSVGETARRIEDLGFDGMGFADTQIIYYDPYVAMGVAAHATSRLRLRTMVSTPVTRHPSVMAAAIATVQQESAGRAVLGLGRGDSAAALIGEPAFTGKLFERYIVQVQGYLRGEEVVLDNGTHSRSDWIGREPKLPKVPVDIAATGPRIIAISARVAEGVSFSVGAEPQRMSWAINYARQARKQAGLNPSTLRLGAFVPVFVHPDAAFARRFIRGSIAPLARFSALSPSASEGIAVAEDRAIVKEIGRVYDMGGHGHAEASHIDVITDSFVDRWAVAGPSEYCISRLAELAGTGLDNIVIGLSTRGMNNTEVGEAWTRFAREVMPALRSIAQKK
jgi:5,10-methylenetetrahydromethanopterin reductase